MCSSDLFSCEMIDLSSHKLAAAPRKVMSMEEMDDDSVAKVAAEAISLSMPLMPEAEDEEEGRGLLMTTLVAGTIVLVALRFILCCGKGGGWVVALLCNKRKEECDEERVEPPK